MRKILIPLLLLIGFASLAQSPYTKSQLHNGIDTEIRRKAASQARLSTQLDSIVASLVTLTELTAALDTVSGGGVTKAGNGIILVADSVVADTTKMAQKSDLSGWLTGTLNSNVTIDGDDTYNLSLGTTGVGARLGQFSLSAINFSNINFFGGGAIGAYNQDLIVGALGASGVLSLVGGLVAINTNSIDRLRIDHSGNVTLNIGSDATGDIPYRNSSGYLTRLAKGAEGTILRAGASVPAYSTFTIPNTISALSTFVSNSANVLTEVTPSAGQSIRVNAGGTAWEAYTPGSGGSSALSDLTAATGTNTINNANNAQEWQWNSLTGNGMSLTSTSTAINHTTGTNALLRIASSGANASSSRTHIGFSSSVANTGTTSTNIAGYFAASGATNNFALQTLGNTQLSTSGTGTNPAFTIYSGGLGTTLKFAVLDNGNVGIGNVSTSLTLARLLVRGGGAGIARFENSSSTQRFTIGENGEIVNNGTSFLVGGTSITSGSVLMDLQSTTKGLLLPRVTNTAAITSPVNGMAAYDAATDEFIFRQNGSWIGLGSGSGIGGSTGSTDNAILTADGTGGSTLQATSLTIDGDRIGSQTNIELDAADSLLVIGDDTNEVILGRNTAGQRLGYLEMNVENSIVMRSESPINITSYGQSITAIESSVGVSPDSAVYISNTTFPTVQQANASYFGAKDVDGSSDLFSLSEAGVEINLSGKLTPKVESGTSFTIDASHIAQGTYTSNGSAVTVTVPAGLQIGSVILIMQEGAGTVTITEGANVDIIGKTATTGVGDFIWLWLYKKDGGTSYYVGR